MFAAPPRKEGNTVAGKTEYKNNWQKENVDRINLIVPKGQKDAIKAHAEARGESVNGFINRAVKEVMEKENGDQLFKGRREGHQRYGQAHKAADKGRH